MKKKGKEMKQFSVALPADMLKKLRQEADKKMIPLAALIRMRLAGKV